MAKLPAFQFARPEMPATGTLVYLAASDGKLPAALEKSADAQRVARAVSVSEFKGKLGACVSVLAPEGGADRILVIGCGDLAEAGEHEWIRVGGRIAAECGAGASVAILAETAAGALSGEAVAALAAGARLRLYSFDHYKTKDRKETKPGRYSFHFADAAAARKAWKHLEAVCDGVSTARDLVNEPANILGTVEFAERAAALASHGLEVEILDEKQMKKLKMGALLGVAQGSVRPARMVVMRLNGGKAKDRPVAFVGKGVVFDTGGISIKPAAGMEDMKGDMGGAAAVTGLMHALAARKARVNAIGIIGLVENMPDGNAQRPGDIVTSMSGQTIEVLNTDAEGRLVLADALWYCQDRYKPQFMINLATLTGAIMVALGQEHAGLFSNNDELAGRLHDAGQKTKERVWRMPLLPEYDKLIDSKTADMKNIGGRNAGAITAAQFLQRFVNSVPWAHLDIAGTAMGSPKNEFNQSWGSGYGVRLLDRLVADHYE